MSAHRRFTKTHPCPICGGHDGLVRGRGVRCFGYMDTSGRYARCTREDQAGGLPQNRDGTYSHWLGGACRCGQTHGEASDRARHVVRTTLRRSEPRFRSFLTLSAFLRRRYGDGASIRHWIYQYADGSEAFRVVRVDYRAPNGAAAKSYRPCHQAEGGKWHLARPEGRLPLYRLPAILTAPPGDTVVVVEGEKCADIAVALGFALTTTSAHGAKAPQLTDWSPLAGRRVAVLADADAEGAGYAAQVTAHLAALDPPADVRLVRLPGLADGEDLEQFVAQRRAARGSDAAILTELHALIAAPR